MTIDPEAFFKAMVETRLDRIEESIRWLIAGEYDTAERALIGIAHTQVRDNGDGTVTDLRSEKLMAEFHGSTP